MSDVMKIARPGRGGAWPIALVAALTLVVLPALGCGNGDGDPTTVTAEQLSGWWEGFANEVTTLERQPDEGLQLIEFLGTGSSLFACGDTLTVMNGMITDPSDPTDPTLMIIDANTIIGSTTLPGAGEIEVKFTRRTRPAPTGTFNLAGTLFGGPFNLSSAVPTVQIDEDGFPLPGGMSTEIEVAECGPMRKETTLTIRVPGPTSVVMTGGPLTVVPILTGAANEAAVTVSVEDGGSENATAGSITFTQGALTLGSRPAATFMVTMSGGGMLTGSFEAEVFGISR